MSAVVLAADEYLDALASRAKAEYVRGRQAAADTVDCYFAIGHCLLEAREALASDPAFGRWFAAQDFPFSTQWSLVLRRAATHEAPVRELLQSQLSSSRSPNIEKAVKRVTAALDGGRDDTPEVSAISSGENGADYTEALVVPTVFSAIVIDPPWRYDNVATRGAAEDHYQTMSLEDLAALELPAAEDAHLYLWVTNSFIRDGFDLMDQWGFTYKTCLTWCKPQIGMGNWFRSTTEHVLFGVRGRLPTLRNDVPTHFVADRTRHSAKPESFYDLVESCTPGPWLEMFARRRRFGWHVWGNEA